MTWNDRTAFHAIRNVVDPAPNEQPSKHKTLTQWCFNVGPAPETVSQHLAIIVSTSCACWEEWVKCWFNVGPPSLTLDQLYTSTWCMSRVRCTWVHMKQFRVTLLERWRFFIFKFNVASGQLLHTMVDTESAAFSCSTWKPESRLLLVTLKKYLGQNCIHVHHVHVIDFPVENMHKNEQYHYY